MGVTFIRHNLFAAFMMSQGFNRVCIVIVCNGVLTLTPFVLASSSSVLYYNLALAIKLVHEYIDRVTET